MAPQRADIQHAPSLTFRVHLVIASFEQRLTGTCEFHRIGMFCGQQLQESDPTVPFFTPPSGSVTLLEISA